MADKPDVETQLIPIKRDATSGMRLIRSEELLLAESEILIQHAGLIYHLRVTKAGKLILTK
jgi:hemin uptake protein HemP